MAHTFGGQTSVEKCRERISHATDPHIYSLHSEVCISNINITKYDKKWCIYICIYIHIYLYIHVFKNIIYRYIGHLDFVYLVIYVSWMHVAYIETIQYLYTFATNQPTLISMAWHLILGVKSSKSRYVFFQVCRLPLLVYCWMQSIYTPKSHKYLYIKIHKYRERHWQKTRTTTTTTTWQTYCKTTTDLTLPVPNTTCVSSSLAALFTSK